MARFEGAIITEKLQLMFQGLGCFYVFICLVLHTNGVSSVPGKSAKYIVTKYINDEQTYMIYNYT